jgi:drug/metabolite transporter (DMT)-like permease
MSTIEATSARGIPGVRAEAAPPWKIWTALWIVYIVWGSTYLAIALMVETIPPLLGAGFRFMAVGLILLPILAFRRGASVWRPSRPELLSAAFVGLMLPGANAVISVAEKTVPSGCWWRASRCG